MLSVTGCSKSKLNQEQEYHMTDQSNVTLVVKPQILKGRVTGIDIYINGKQIEEIEPFYDEYLLNIFKDNRQLMHARVSTANASLQPEDFSRIISINGIDYIYIYNSLGEIIDKKQINSQPYKTTDQP
jgi:hypothetical protein